MATWSPWRGCHRTSRGCDHCYIHRSDKTKGVDTQQVVKTDEFDRIVKKNKKGDYVVKPFQTVYVCFRSDFFLEEADDFRQEAWRMMYERRDLNFIMLTKRIERFDICLPDASSYEGEFVIAFSHVSIGVSVEDQGAAAQRIPALRQAPIAHRMIVLQPLLESVDIEMWLDHKIDLVMVGGEAGIHARPFDRSWALDVRRQCIKKGVAFDYRQVGTFYVEEGAMEKVPTHLLTKRAKEEGLDYQPHR